MASYNDFLHLDAVAYSRAFYGQGTVPILLDDVRCTNTESRLIDCPYTAIDNCAHSEDAAISCTTGNVYASIPCILIELGGKSTISRWSLIFIIVSDTSSSFKKMTEQNRWNIWNGSKISVGSCIDDDEGYLLPTQVWKKKKEVRNR